MLSCHDLGDYLQLSVVMSSPEELAAARLCPINCSSFSPFPLQNGEFRKFSECSKSLTKAGEPEAPWTPQPGKNAVREGETHKAVDEGENGEEAGRQTVQFSLLDAGR